MLYICNKNEIIYIISTVPKQNNNKFKNTLLIQLFHKVSGNVNKHHFVV